MNQSVSDIEKRFDDIARDVYSGYSKGPIIERFKVPMTKRIMEAVKDEFDAEQVIQDKELMHYLKSRHVDTISSIFAFDNQVQNLLFVEIGRRCAEFEKARKEKYARVVQSEGFAAQIELGTQRLGYENTMKELIDEVGEHLQYEDSSARKVVREGDKILIASPLRKIEVPRSCYPYLEHVIARAQRINEKAKNMDDSKPRRKGGLGFGSW